MDFPIYSAEIRIHKPIKNKYKPVTMSFRHDHYVLWFAFRFLLFY